jgi:hypothetical protein
VKLGGWCLTGSCAYRDKKVVGVFVPFSCATSSCVAHLNHRSWLVRVSTRCCSDFRRQTTAHLQAELRCLLWGCRSTTQSAAVKVEAAAIAATLVRVDVDTAGLFGGALRMKLKTCPALRRLVSGFTTPLVMICSVHHQHNINVLIEVKTASACLDRAGVWQPNWGPFSHCPPVIVRNAYPHGRIVVRTVCMKLQPIFAQLLRLSSGRRQMLQWWDCKPSWMDHSRANGYR